MGGKEDVLMEHNTLENTLTCRDVSKTFYGDGRCTEVLKNINFNIKKNEFVVIFGPGQCGKTTLIKMLAGLELCEEGEICLEQRKVTQPTPDLGVVYQTTALFPWCTVRKNVEFGPSVRKLDKEETRRRSEHFIDLVGLKGFEDSYPKALSGGMRQRVGIARAYCNDPKVLLMDEPFGHLDAQTRYMMEEALENIWQKEKRTVVFVTNNIEEAIYLADRIILLTNRPASIKHEFKIDLPRPRSYVDPEFLRLRETITRAMDKTM